jgi:hypothetical protein
MSSHKLLVPEPLQCLRAYLQSSLLMLAAAVLLSTTPLAGAQDGNGLRSEDSWPRWQTRIGVQESVRSDTALPTARAGSAWNDPNLGSSRQGLSLFGDYYLLQQGKTSMGSYSGGLRATGGLSVGAWGTPWVGVSADPAALQAGYASSRRSFSLQQLAGGGGADEATDSLPYLGVGYTGLQSLRGTGGGWGFSADLGLMGLKPRSAVRLGAQSSSEPMRDLQLSPVLQVGVSYAF